MISHWKVLGLVIGIYLVGGIVFSVIADINKSKVSNTTFCNIKILVPAIVLLFLAYACVDASIKEISKHKQEGFGISEVLGTDIGAWSVILIILSR